MSQLERLIQQLCPDGVEYRKVEEISQTLTPKTKVKSHSYLENGKYPVIDQGQDYIGGYTDEEDAFPAGEYVIFGDHTCAVKFVDFPFVQGADGVKVIVPKRNIICKYLYYCMSNIKIDVSYARHWSKMRVKTIPVPPMPVQQEIVRILDSFTQLTAELTAELTARRKQYEYYHNVLMDFTNENIEYKSVGELFEIKNGLNKEKSAFGKGQPIINFTDVYNNRWLTKESFNGLVDVSEAEIERYSARIGDVFFTRTSETKEDIGMSSTLIDDIPNCVFSGFVLRARPTTNLLLPKFCSYYFSTRQVRNVIIRYASFTTRATTTGPKLSKIMVPLLPIERQQRIVEILDRFDTLCNDLTSGLPAEIEARRKQYEYYRDKLLTFPKRNA